MITRDFKDLAYRLGTTPEQVLRNFIENVTMSEFSMNDEQVEAALEYLLSAETLPGKIREDLRKELNFHKKLRRVRNGTAQTV